MGLEPITSIKTTAIVKIEKSSLERLIEWVKLTNQNKKHQAVKD